MDPLPSSLSFLAGLLPTALLKQGLPTQDSTLLMALLGQDVQMLFEALDVGSVQLKLPSGQTVTAQGELPFPPGTELTVRVQPGLKGESGLRLQVLEAKPPTVPEVLAPLQQGEASALMARLQQAELPPELKPLLELLMVMGYAPEPVSTRPQTIVPEISTILVALRSLPPKVLVQLSEVLALRPSTSPAELAKALETWLRNPEPLQGESPTIPTAQGETIPTPVATPKRSGTEAPTMPEPVTRFLALLANHPELPENTKQILDDWIIQLFQKPAPEGHETTVQTIRHEAVRNPSPPPLQSASSPKPVAPQTHEALQLEFVLHTHQGSPPEVPDTWEAWIRGTTKILSDPKASPREATFHALQAKEQTAFYEIPLPWSPQTPLHLWVESDSEGGKKRRDAETKRVLMGCRFSQLGETRVGLERSPTLLQVRIWTEHPELLAKEEQHLTEELEGLDRRVSLKILPLNPGQDGSIPSLRSVVAGPSLHVLG